MKVKISLLLTLLIVFSSFSQVYAIGDVLIRDTKLLKIGCYRYTDNLKASNSMNQESQSINNLGPQNSNVPDSYLGKTLKQVDCFTMHHLEISLIGKSPVKGSLKLDSIGIRSRCLINNIAVANSDHESHSSQLYVNIWRIGRSNYYNCGVSGIGSVVPTAPNYKTFETFYAPVLRVNG